mmetsp:Transcript_4025/g.7871  ORF Transcript_4025/g.7871 Transcript_4025/m.7871 type:complete len:86 (-) Transcript_4025:193-450(-)
MCMPTQSDSKRLQDSFARSRKSARLLRSRHLHPWLCFAAWWLAFAKLHSNVIFFFDWQQTKQKFFRSFNCCCGAILEALHDILLC